MNIKKLESNSIGRDFIVGDIHGCYDELMAMLEHIKFEPTTDRLFSVGDLIDRGPKSLDCLKLVDNPWFHCVLGNHEEMMLMSIKTGRSNWIADWKRNGGKWGYEYRNEVAMGDKAAFIKKYLEILPLVIAVGEGEKRFNIVHAELYDGAIPVPVGDENIDNWKFVSAEHVIRDRMLWGREIIHRIVGGDIHNNLSITYCGHTPIKECVIIGSQVFIDTGCVFSVTSPGKNTETHLTMVEHGEQKIIKYYPFDKRFVTSYLADLQKE